ncbi:MAG TPA: trimeric intracellular cation channel family protein [Kiritimatiellia bacterium]|nr:trimeric intracellular cation channel family protein [Kiritimatiellia bacterium]HMO99860.1 trimeric intracellular cation channel family protein [Kiritimatiellia bacterium]HMP96372.1 trimeric intracellular cation channel family protein [Kiritimatiellia bacterium]
MNLLYVFSLMGVAVFAVSGALAAGRKKLDVFGVVVVAVVTALGGGTLRDLLLDRNPIFWIGDTHYLLVASATGLLTVLYVRHHPLPYRMLLYADGLGLAFFTISGTRIAEASGVSPGVCMLMGCMTGVVGGIVRDVLTAEVPLLLRDREIYATASLAGAGIYLLLVRGGGVSIQAASVVGMAVVVLLRFASINGKLRMPAVKIKHP